MSRRQVLRGGCALLALGACSAPASWAARPPKLADRQLVTREIAAGVHVRRGVDEDASAGNENAIANLGFIVGTDSVAVIDPGGSMRDGGRLRARIREVTPLPIRFVILTHAHPDHIFGSGAFQADAPTFVGHARMPLALAQRGEYHQRRLNEILGQGAAGPVVVPTRLVDATDVLDLGGRSLRLTAHPVAHSDCDLSVVDTATATLLAGDLVFQRRIPSLEGSLKGWRRELAALAQASVKRTVPGHGPVSVDWPAGAGATARYLKVLQSETRAAVRQGMDIETAVNTVGQSEKARWLLFDDYNGHNVTQAFKEIEWE